MTTTNHKPGEPAVRAAERIVQNLSIYLATHHRSIIPDARRSAMVSNIARIIDGEMGDVAMKDNLLKRALALICMTQECYGTGVEDESLARDIKKALRLGEGK